MENKIQPQTVQQPIAGYQPQPQPSPQLPSPPTKIPWHILDKRMIIPLIVIIVLIAAGFAVRYFLSQPSEETVQEAAQAPFEEAPQALPAVENPLVTQCRNTGSDSARDECLMKMANETKSADFCNEMLQVSGPVSVNSCYMMLAVELSQLDYCYWMENFAGDYSFNHCVFDVARVQGNPYRCLVISPEETKYTKSACAAQFNLTESELTRIYGPLPG